MRVRNAQAKRKCREKLLLLLLRCDIFWWMNKRVEDRESAKDFAALCSKLVELDVVVVTAGLIFSIY